MSEEYTPIPDPMLEVVYSVQTLQDDTAQRAIMTKDCGTWHVGIISKQFPNNQAEIETSFTCDDIERLAEGIMKGDPKALRTQGLARKLAAYCLMKLDAEGLLAFKTVPGQQLQNRGVRHVEGLDNEG